MKKVLFATTALVATAGVASADITLSGNAEMGVFSEGSRSIGLADDATGLTFSTSETEAAFHTSVDVTFTASGSTDNGLTFGFSVDLDEADNINSSNEDAVAVFLSGDFGRVTMGDTDGALDWALSELDLGGGSINDAHTNHAAFWAHSDTDGFFDGQILRYQYEMAGFGAAVSLELDDSSDDYNWGIGANYEGEVGGGLTLIAGIGYQNATGSTEFASLTAGVSGTNPLADTQVISLNDVQLWGVSFIAEHESGFSAGINYGYLEVDNVRVVTDVDGGGAVTTNAGQHERTLWSIGVGYAFDAFSVGFNYGEVESSGAADIFDATGYGLAASYDLGGGLSLLAGWGESDYRQGGTATNWDIGLSMSF